MKTVSLLFIRFYQRYLSPRKGFCCAYKVINGGRSCSAFTYTAISRAGGWRGTILAKRRMASCGASIEKLNRYRMSYPAKRNAEAGYCAVGEALDIGACALDVMQSCDFAGFMRSGNRNAGKSNYPKRHRR